MPAAPQSNSKVIHKLAYRVSLYCMWLKKKPSWQFSLSATQHLFCGSCPISFPVNWSAPWKRPHLHSADKVNTLCDRTIFVIQPMHFAHTDIDTHKSVLVILSVADQTLVSVVTEAHVMFFVGGILWEITLCYIHWFLHAYKLYSLNFQGLIYCSIDISSHKHRSSSVSPPVT